MYNYALPSPGDITDILWNLTFGGENARKQFSELLGNIANPQQETSMLQQYLHITMYLPLPQYNNAQRIWNRGSFPDSETCCSKWLAYDICCFVIKLGCFLYALHIIMHTSCNNLHCPCLIWLDVYLTFIFLCFMFSKFSSHIWKWKPEVPFPSKWPSKHCTEQLWWWKCPGNSWEWLLICNIRNTAKSRFWNTKIFQLWLKTAGGPKARHSSETRLYDAYGCTYLCSTRIIAS